MVPPFNLVSNVKSIIKLLSILAILVASMFSVSSCTEDWEDAYLAIDQNNFSIPLIPQHFDLTLFISS